MKAIICMVIAGLTLYTLQPQSSQIPVKIDAPTITAPATIIDKAAVIKAIKAQGILCTLEVVTAKEFEYNDSYKTVIPQLTQRKFKLNLETKTFLGIDTSQITIETEGKNLTVFLPAPILLSMENTKIEFINDVGLLRTNLTDADKLQLLSKAGESVRVEVMSNENKEKATAQARAILRGLLKQIPNVQSVEII